jgi:fucose permease
VLASCTELLVLGIAFRYENASKYSCATEGDVRTYSSKIGTILKYPGTWVSAIYFLAYVGTETAISGWVVSFMLRAREATSKEASLSSSAFWAGMAVGRFALGTVTDRFGVAGATLHYISVAVALEILFALVRPPVVSIVIMALLGFFMGPLFPSGIVVLLRLLPKELHVAAVSFVASIGQVGAALLPFAIGAIIDISGIGVFRFSIIAFTAFTLALWILFARIESLASTSEPAEQSQ